jgi:membrane protease YdiL (CAAX protease family)
LLHQKKGNSSDPLGGLAMVAMMFFMAFVHAALGWMLLDTLDTGRIMAAERPDRRVVGYIGSIAENIEESRARLEALEKQSTDSAETALDLEKNIQTARDRLTSQRDDFTSSAARWRKYEFGGSESDQRRLVEAHFQKFGIKGFIDEDDLPEISMADPTTIPRACWPFVGLILLWWLMMIVFQGEGLELDIQRRRHPMWEWVLSHPVRPVAAFAADMLSPLMANPVYFSAPVFWWILLGFTHGPLGGFVGALAVGLPFAVAASCLNKALEISAMLRLTPRTRGAALGIMSWIGYAAMMLPMFAINGKALKVFLTTWSMRVEPWVPTWPVRALIVGWGERPVLWQAIVSGVILAVILLAASVVIAWWGLRRGLQAEDGRRNVGQNAKQQQRTSRLAAKNPLHYKELLWFWRDKGAVIQAFLIPLTIASFQVFNFRGLMNEAVSHWNGICGAAVICGTYFLLVLGPRSLASEGGALWIPMTWPQGMEDLLKAKARLWWMISNIVVWLILAAAVAMFPQDWWRIGLVAAGWCFFGRSLAEKSVTLVSAPSSSGEYEPAPRGRQWAAMVGTFAFGMGVITQTWDLAMMGVVFSALTTAAIWQNFRARLPYLFDPWSEKLPPAPSLMHAMIGIAVMVEAIALVSGFTVAFGDRENLWQARAFAYGFVGFFAWLGMTYFLAGRGVRAANIWQWEPTPRISRTLMASGMAVLAGCALGGLALLYTEGLKALPLTREWMLELERLTAVSDVQKIGMLIIAVGMAPLAEEYFFRGLLFRALDREWGGLRAMIGSAAYFAMYHPPVAWPPVFAVGLANAWLFKRSRSLVPCVLCHMAYNAVVIGTV